MPEKDMFYGEGYGITSGRGQQESDLSCFCSAPCLLYKKKTSKGSDPAKTNVYIPAAEQDL